MSATRQELESRLQVFAESLAPHLTVAYENVPFTKPTSEPYLECFLISAGTTAITVDASRNRERGTFQVNVWSPSGRGTAEVESIGKGVVDTFKVIPKLGTVSIEQPGNTGRLIIEINGWIILPVTFPYRVETEA
jgi:hypothetical protein